MVHGDLQYLEIDKRILGLIDRFIPGPDRLGFIFHERHFPWLKIFRSSQGG
jgi:hypothetical protein